jgi:O-antigen/teichoic acid export membrane protein
MPAPHAVLSSLPQRLRRLLSAGAAGDAAGAGGGAIASNVAVQVAMRLISMAISIVTVSLTARTLSPGGFGVYNGMLSYVGLFGVLTDLGFTTAAMQRMTADPDRESEWLGALAGARGALSIVATVICAVTIPLALSNDHHGHLVGLILTGSILSTGPNALTAVFQSRMRAGLALSFSVLSSVLWLGAVIVLTIVHGSVVAFAAANLGQMVIIAALQYRVTSRYAHIAWRAGRAHWRPLFVVALPLGIASVLITVYYQIDSVLLLQIAGPRETGIYGAAYRFLSPLLFLPAAVMSSFFPVLSAVHRDDPERVRRLIQICADTMAIIALPVLAVSLALSGQIVHFLYGSGYQRTAGVLPILMIAFVSICFGSLAGYLAPILHLQWRLALYSAIGAAANVVLNLVLIPRHGAFGSAWATVITEVLTMVLMLSTSLRALHLRVALGKLSRTVAVACAMTAVMFAARPLGLFPAGILGVLLYAGGLLGLRVFSWQELRALRSG